jgi:hypothetical protein
VFKRHGSVRYASRRYIIVKEFVMHRHFAVLFLTTTLLTGYAYAQNNEPPPAGPVVLDLNGTPVPHTFTTYSVGFTASSTTSDISFAFREDPAFLHLDNVTVRTGGGPNLLVNGDFEAGPVGANAPTGWTYLNIFGAIAAGTVEAGCGVGGSNCYFDGAVQAYDSITQAIPTTTGALYTITFQLTDDGPLTTFRNLSTNGQPSTGGNGIGLLVYAGNGTPVPATVPLPAALPLFASGLGALGLLGWRRKRKAASA